MRVTTPAMCWCCIFFRSRGITMALLPHWMDVDTDDHRALRSSPALQQKQKPALGSLVGFIHYSSRMRRPVAIGFSARSPAFDFQSADCSQQCRRAVRRDGFRILSLPKTPAQVALPLTKTASFEVHMVACFDRVGFST